MNVHSCCCILFSCIVWFEITFQNDLNLHSKFGWKLEKKKKRRFFPLFLFGLLAQFQRRPAPFPPCGLLTLSAWPAPSYGPAGHPRSCLSFPPCRPTRARASLLSLHIPAFPPFPRPAAVGPASLKANCVVPVCTPSLCRRLHWPTRRSHLL